MGRRKLTAAEKAEKKRRRGEFKTILINGKQKRVRLPPTIDGMDAHEFMLRNADPIWLHENGMWEELEAPEIVDSHSQPVRRSLFTTEDTEATEDPRSEHWRAPHRDPNPLWPL